MLYKSLSLILAANVGLSPDFPPIKPNIQPYSQNSAQTQASNQKLPKQSIELLLKGLKDIQPIPDVTSDDRYATVRDSSEDAAHYILEVPIPKTIDELISEYYKKLTEAVGTLKFRREYEKFNSNGILDSRLKQVFDTYNSEFLKRIAENGYKPNEETYKLLAPRAVLSWLIEPLRNGTTKEFIEHIKKLQDVWVQDSQNPIDLSPIAFAIAQIHSADFPDGKGILGPLIEAGRVYSLFYR